MHGLYIFLLLCGEGGKEGREGRMSKHCCCANIAVQRCCMIVNALNFV